MKLCMKSAIKPMNTTLAASISLSLLSLAGASLGHASEAECSRLSGRYEVETYPSRARPSETTLITFTSPGSVTVSGDGKATNYDSKTRQVQLTSLDVSAHLAAVDCASAKSRNRFARLITHALDQLESTHESMDRDNDPLGLLAVTCAQDTLLSALQDLEN